MKLLCFLLILALPTSLKAADRPNIVLIISDDQGYADSSCYEHPPEVATPNIDRIAAAGTRFTNGYASGVTCSPSRAGLLTGRYQQRFGFYDTPDSRIGLPLGEKTLADYLRSAGYATGAFGKWHLGLEPAYHPVKRGFDEFYGFLGHGGHSYTNLNADPAALHNALRRNETVLENESGYLTDNIAREAVSFIDRNRQRPFFAYVAFNAVHAPIESKKEDKAGIATGDPTRDTYLGVLRGLDNAIGRILDTLEKNQLADNTVVVFVTDNGGAHAVRANNGSLRGYKQMSYEGGIRVPYLVAWPAKLPKNATNREMVIFQDILPTLLAAAGTEPTSEAPVDGRNLLPLLSGQARGPVHDALFWSRQDKGCAGAVWAVRAGDWKLLRNKGEIELYDLASDPGETRNLAAAQPEKTKELLARWENWQKDFPPRLRPGGKGDAQDDDPETDAQRDERRQQRKKAKGQPYAPTT